MDFLHLVNISESDGRDIEAYPQILSDRYRNTFLQPRIAVEPGGGLESAFGLTCSSVDRCLFPFSALFRKHSHQGCRDGDDDRAHE